MGKNHAETSAKYQQTEKNFLNETMTKQSQNSI